MTDDEEDGLDDFVMTPPELPKHEEDEEKKMKDEKDDDILVLDDGEDYSATLPAVPYVALERMAIPTQPLAASTSPQFVNSIWWVPYTCGIDTMGAILQAINRRLPALLSGTVRQILAIADRITQSTLAVDRQRISDEFRKRFHHLVQGCVLVYNRDYSPQADRSAMLAPLKKYCSLRWLHALFAFHTSNASVRFASRCKVNSAHNKVLFPVVLNCTSQLTCVCVFKIDAHAP